MQATELMKRMADMVEQTGQPTLAERALPGGLALKVEALPEALRRDLSELEGERPGGKWSRSTACSCLLYTSPSPRDGLLSRMPSSA